MKPTLYAMIARCIAGGFVLAAIVALFAMLAWDDGRTDIIRCDRPGSGSGCAY